MVDSRPQQPWLPPPQHDAALNAIIDAALPTRRGARAQACASARAAAAPAARRCRAGPLSTWAASPPRASAARALCCLAALRAQGSPRPFEAPTGRRPGRGDAAPERVPARLLARAFFRTTNRISYRPARTAGGPRAPPKMPRLHTTHNTLWETLNNWERHIADSRGGTTHARARARARLHLGTPWHWCLHVLAALSPPPHLFARVRARAHQSMEAWV
ncbi:MAG: hypothetical protein J3K34DRAFT_443473 [Monoraphidium minutum]|nr:MAG: hypothetical protein J3K34DRAFT_443473 [Monoraphidium minutum]